MTSPTPAERAALKVAEAAAQSPSSAYGLPNAIVFALGAAGLLIDPDTAVELAEYRRQLPLLLAERQKTNEALAELTVAQRLAEGRALPARVVGKRSRETPSACRHCGIGQREHFQQWTAAAGWHQWVAPTDEQVKERMLARRSAAASGGASC